MRTAKIPRKELAVINRVLQRAVLPRRARHSLEKKLLAAIDTKDERPVPEAIRRAIAEAQKRRRRKPAFKQTNVRVLQQRSRRERLPIDWAALLAYISQQDRGTRLTIDAATFVNLVSEGAVGSVSEGDSLGRPGIKTAYAEVGFADLEGPNAQAWNRDVFGFRSSFSVPSGSHHVRLTSQVSLDFTWPNGYLEALSFGRASWGEITANVQLEVILAGGSAYSSGVRTILSEVSPRGDWETGAIGVFSSLNETRNATLEVEFDISSPAGATVGVFELSELIAQRHHRSDRCTAVIWATSAWAALSVQIL